MSWVVEGWFSRPPTQLGDPRHRHAPDRTRHHRWPLVGSNQLSEHTCITDALLLAQDSSVQIGEPLNPLSRTESLLEGLST